MDTLRTLLITDNASERRKTVLTVKQQSNDKYSGRLSIAKSEQRTAVEPLPHRTTLRFPILPVLHLVLVCAHLSISTVIPYLLVTNLIQPMVLWLILAVCLVIEVVYLLPGLLLDMIGLIRGRPIHSAWLQSGVYLVVNIFSIIPQALAIFLLINADQLPPCASPWRYAPPPFTTFLTPLPGSPCHKLPTVMILGLLNLLLVFSLIVLTIWTISWDVRMTKRQMKPFEPGPLVPLGGVLLQSKIQPHKMPIVSRRWTVGAGQLLWEIESAYSERRKR